VFKTVVSGTRGVSFTAADGGGKVSPLGVELRMATFTGV